MAIQWFPGHMTSARKKAAETLAVVDVVIEVVDARLPEASSNPMIHELRKHRQRPCLKLLNKADVADPLATKAWLDYFNKQPGVKAVAISCKKAADVAQIPRLCQRLAPHRNDAIKPLRMMIMGIPNVGKSTLMNALVKRKIAAVGDQPAVTKSQQRYDLSSSQTIIDTPGMLWPKIAHPQDGLMLAASHAVGINAYIDEEVGTFLSHFLVTHYPSLLQARYKFSTAGMDGIAVLEAIAKLRNCRRQTRQGTVLDLEKASIVLLTDYRTGHLGRISLETPASRMAMLAEASLATAVTSSDEADDALDHEEMAAIAAARQQS